MTVNLEEEIGRLLKDREQTLAVAESCTGGLVCHRLTNVPGSSAYFLCGYVTYSNGAKQTVLRVGQETLRSFGAVSRETVAEMVTQAREISRSDWALALSGIAGPGGGSPGKPVGLVYIAIDGLGGTRIAKFQFEGERCTIKEKSAEAALKMLRQCIIESG